MADNSRTRTPSATVRDMVMFLLEPLTTTGLLSVDEFAGNDLKEIINYKPELVPDQQPVAVFYHQATERRPEPEGIFHFSIFIIARNIVQPDLALTEAQNIMDSNVSTSVISCIDHKILGNQQKFQAVGDGPVTIGSGGQTTIFEHKFTMEDY